MRLAYAYLSDKSSILLPKRISVQIPRTTIQGEELYQIEPSPRIPWHRDVGDGPDISVPEMFDLAVKAVKKVASDSEGFFRSQATSSREYFAGLPNPAPFLEQNYNFDTGLPSTFNNELKSLSSAEILRFGLPMINQNYERIL